MLQGVFDVSMYGDFSSCTSKFISHRSLFLFDTLSRVNLHQLYWFSL